MKFSKKVLSLGLATAMVAGSAVSFAIPNNTVVLDTNKAYDLDIFFGDLPQDVVDAIAAADGIWFDADGSGYMDAFTGTAMTQAQQDALTNISYMNEDGSVDTYATFASETPVEENLTVESVSAINSTTVEVVFNQAPAADATLTYKVAGVAYTPVMDGAKATLTVAQLADDVATAVVVNDGTADLYNSTVTYDMNQITTIAPVKTTYTSQIGNEVTVQYAVTDEDGDAVVGKQVFVRAVSSLTPTLANIEQTVTTDANGIASVKINRAEVSTDTLTAYVVERPIVASTNGVTIDWNAAATGLVSVDATQNITLGNGTAKEYTVTAKKSDGTNYTGRLNMDIAVTGLAVTDLTVERWNGTAWVAATGSGTAQVNYTLVAGDNGQAKFRVYNDQNPLGTFTPTFFYDTETVGNNTLNNADPRSIGSTVTYVTQTPSITFVEKEAGDVIATTAVNNDGKNVKLYTLEVKDQFGNPFRGTVKFDELARVDGLATTTATGNPTFEVDSNEDGTFDGGANNSLDVNLAIGVGDSNNDSKATVRVVNATAEKFTPVVYVDMPNTGTPAEVADMLDDNDVKVQGDEVTAQARVAATIVSEDVTTGDVAVGGNKIVKFTFTDQFGTAFTPGAGNLELAVEGTNKGAIVIDSVDLSYVAANNATYGFVADSSPNAATASNLTGASNIIAVKLDSGAANDEGTVRVWIDSQNDSTFQVDELNGVSSTVKFVAGQLTGGAFNAAVTANDAVVSNADENAFVVSDLAGDDQVLVTYGVTDQAGQALDLTTAVNVVFTVENTSTTNSITVRDATGVNTLGTVAAGATGTFTVVTSGSPDVSAIEIESAVANRVNVTAKVEGNDASVDNQPIVWTSDVVGASQTYTGTVVAVDKTNNWILVQTDLGYVLVDDYLAGGTFTAVTATVNGNTASAAQFESNLSVGDTIKVTTDATPDATFELTNK